MTIAEITNPDGVNEQETRKEVIGFRTKETMMN
jgi:hypothetical protein